MVYKVNEKINKIIDEFKEDFARTAEVSRDGYLKSLPAGSKIPEANKIFDQYNLDEFVKRANRYRDDVIGILDDVVADIKKAKTQAPDTEAVNVLTLMNARSNVSADELYDVLDRYGSNYQVYRACQDISKRNDLGILADHPLQGREQDMNDLQVNLNRLFTYPDACKNVDNGYYDFIKANIDNVLAE